MTIFAAFYSVSVVIFFITARYRLPIVIPLFIYGASGLSSIWNRWNLKHYKQCVSFIFGLIALILFCGWTPNWMASRVVRPGLSTPYTIAGSMELYNLHNVPVAAEEFEMAKKLFPEGADIHAYLGDCYARMGKIREAIMAYQEAVTIDPIFYEAYANRGVLYFQMKDYPMAFKDFQMAYQLRPTDPINRQNYQRVREILRQGILSK